MPVNDPVGDMLTRMRNASRAHHERLVLPASRLKTEVLRVLKDEGFIADFLVHDRKPQGEITVMLKYGPDRTPVLAGIKRVSKPGIRRYVQSHLIDESYLYAAPRFDGVAQLWFDSVEAFAAAFASPAGNDLMADGRVFIDAPRMTFFMAQEHIQIASR